MEDCAICLEPMKTDIVLLRCLHKFHTECILHSRVNHNNFGCPICRRNAEFLTRCNIKKNTDGSISYTPFREKCCCSIM